MTELVVISDLHCGIWNGLTPPSWWVSVPEDDDLITDQWLAVRAKRRKAQQEAWAAYLAMKEYFGTPDILLANGDLIAGSERKQGGAELLTADRQEQCEMAVRCLQVWSASKVLITYGTAYHVGEGAEDFELQIAEKLENNNTHVEIGGNLFFDIEGVVFNAKHKVGSSSVPYGRGTQIYKEAVWNLLKSAVDEEPKADFLIRSHVHYYSYIETPYQRAMTTPALQMRGGRLGRICSGEIHWGAVKIIIDNGQIKGVDKWITTIKDSKPEVLKMA